MQAQTAVLAIAAIVGWGYMLFFVMAFRLTGPFVVMIVFLAAFSQAFFILFDNNGKNKRKLKDFDKEIILI
jgi:hypothetical protein